MAHDPFYLMVVVDDGSTTLQGRLDGHFGEPLSGWAVKNGAPTATYRLPSGAVEVSLDPSPRPSLMVSMSRDIVNAMGTELPQHLFDLCRATGARLARSISAENFGLTLIAEEELEGALTALHWFQYLPPAVAARWGVAHLERGPFAQTLTDGDGSVALVLPGGPFAVTGQRDAAAHLGFTLRPIVGRNPATGERIVIPYP